MNATPDVDDTIAAALPLPPEPERPDCCNGGCAVCVLEGYPEEMDAWRQRCAEVLAERERRRTAQNVNDQPSS
ncbi:MAG TPA: oxidoreductase-like domain-containing protein [Solimonas sp.]